MGWRSLTPQDVQTQLAGPELEALQDYSRADGQSDPLPEIISQVTDECRGYIMANARNKLGPSGTLAPQVIGAAIAIARWKLSGRLGIGKAAELLQTPQRQKDYEDAQQFLKDVAGGRIAVEQPPDDEAGPEIPEEPLVKFGSNPPVNFNV
jgi:hypothetical protein